MAISSSKIFAVLIGINQYNGEYKNLFGCTKDVDLIKTFLQETVHVPHGQIKIITSPAHPTSNQLPTKANVVKLINNVAEEALKKGPGSLLFLQYSGHGRRIPTKYRELEKGTYDEALCTMKEVLTDVEVSNLLEDLTNKGLTVFVVLDCCHSGGADREDGSLGAIRSPGDSDSPKFIDEPSAIDGPALNDQLSPDSSTDQGGRNATIKRGWFYRTRNHNLLAACQPHELARERPDGNNGHTGVLTYFFHKALNDLYKSKEPVTYERLTNHIVALCEKGNLETPQAPMHLGNRSRLLFSTHVFEDLYNSPQASVTEIKGNKLRYAYLDKGEGHGIHIGDQFRLYGPDQCRFGLPIARAPDAPEVKVRSIDGLKARAIFLTRPGEAAPGWIACLSKRAHLPIISFDTGNLTSSITPLQNEWSHLTPSPGGALVDLIFNPGVGAVTEGPSSLHINVANDHKRLVFLDSKKCAMRYVPSLYLGERDLAKKLAYLLPHLCSYQSLAELQPTKRTTHTPSFKFDIVPDDGNDSLLEWEDEDEAISLPKGRSYNITFRNNSSSVLYVTIFNLGQAYGISQIFPDEGAASFAVGQNDCTPRLPITIQVPELLREAAKKSDFQMRDTFKVLVTKTETDFGRYNQPDLEGWSTWDPDGVGHGRYRNTVTPEQKDRGDFWAQSIDITTKKSDLSHVDYDPAGDDNYEVDVQIEVAPPPALGWFGNRPYGWGDD
ncbi:caspase domain-containing protein [Xylaria sp. FL1777]|nr:caspase domain-containing protein [Xylaria sp. FL1777]